MSNDLLGLHHVGIVVQNLDASADWYEHHLDFKRQSGFAFPGARAVFIVRGDVRLELFQIEGSAPMAPEREAGQTNLKIGGINHLAITVGDLERTVADLQAKGVEVAAPPSTVPNGRGDRYAFIRDNERMLIELFQPG